MMKNKQSLVFLAALLAAPELTLVILGVIGILIGIAFFGLLAWIKANVFLLIGGFIIVVAMIYGFKELFRNKLDNTKGIILIFFIILGIILIIIPYIGILQQAVYPASQASISDKLYTPVNGYIQCEYTGNEIPYGSWDILQNVRKVPLGSDYSYVIGLSPKAYEGDKYMNIVCSTTAGTQGCKIKMNAFCDWGGYVPFYQFGEFNNVFESWKTISSAGELSMSAGENKILRITCTQVNKPFYQIRNYVLPSVAQYTMTEAERKIRVYTEGCAPQGWMDGSGPNCKFITSDTKLQEYIKMQTTSDPLTNKFQFGNILAFGEAGKIKDITVCWQEQPGFVINPMGKLNSRDVTCSIGTTRTVYYADLISTVGGINYFKQGSAVDGYSGSGICCDSSQCSGDLSCENYKCVAKPVNCDIEQCAMYNAGVTKAPYDLEENGKFYRVSDTCVKKSDSVACIERSKTEVACTKSYCDKMSTTNKILSCDYNAGCVEVTNNLLKECPAGACCDGTNNYKLQNCLSDMKCCKTTATYIGTCKSTCEEAKCGNGICETALGENKITCPSDCQGGEDICSSEQLDKGYTQVSKSECASIWCTVGLAKKVDTTICKAPFDWMPIYIIIGILAAMVIIIAVVMIIGKRKYYRK